MTETLTRWWLAVLQHFEPRPRCRRCRTPVDSGTFCSDACHDAEADMQAW